MKKHWQFSRIGKQYTFSAAHYLPMVKDGHPCKRMHGHNYTVEVEVRGDTSAVSGFCNGLDFYDLDLLVKPLIEKLDHQLLNEFIENPTAENLAQWFLDNVRLPCLFSVRVWETPKAWAEAINADGLYHGAHKE